MHDVKCISGSMDDTLSSCINDSNYTTCVEDIGVFPTSLTGASTPATILATLLLPQSLCYDSDKQVRPLITKARRLRTRWYPRIQILDLARRICLSLEVEMGCGNIS